MAENYDDSGKDKDAEFVEQISARLRAPEHVHPSFEKRLMEKVRAEAGIHLPASGSAGRSWWRAERVFSVAPLTGLAIAAGISLIIGVSGVAIGSRISARSLLSNRAASTAQRDTVQIVRSLAISMSGQRAVPNWRPREHPGCGRYRSPSRRDGTSMLLLSTARAGLLIRSL